MTRSKKPRKAVLPVLGKAGALASLWANQLAKMENRPIDALDKIYSALLGSVTPKAKYTKQPGAGCKRAKAAYDAKLRANKAIPGPQGVTRQMARQHHRLKAKQALTVAKREYKGPGGAAVIRSLVDAERVLV